ncbi:MAG: GNAT family N-acetyltransferase [Chloroflexota bacterium]|nr:GNAT family N-acetyltransferase [Chloroflexota bacterium]
MIVYRVLTDIHDLKAVEPISDAIWGVGQGIPDNLMRAFAVHGGLIIGAYDDDQPVGVAAAFLAFHPRTLWSHMAGVLPLHQGRGVGTGLKFAQRRWALEHGYDEIHWTFDPLQRGNIHFNLALLGASVSTYHVNFYGTMGDAITGDLPSDRVVAQWQLNNPVVAALADGRDSRPIPELDVTALILCVDDDGQPIVQPLPDTPRLYAQLPQSLNALRTENPDAALAWRLAQREALTIAFAAGYTAVNSIRIDHAAYLVLERH